MVKRESKKFMTVVTIILFLLIVVYNIYDNNRINVVEQTVKIDNLSQSFNNFKILQITDLHEKRFGKDQKTLVDTINKLDYDIIVITGDIVNSETVNTKPFIELIMSIKKKDLVFFVGGNNDPKVFYKDRMTFFGKELKGLGCILLDNPYAIKKGKNTLWVMQYVYGAKADNDIFKIMKEKDIKIGLNHFPLHKYNYNYNAFSSYKTIKYDLIIAGHYHGGQVRIPLLGAPYVQRGGFKGLFPKQNEVSGLQQEDGFKQYVSRGLGASGHKLLAFRVFDTPEINVIKLTKN